MNKILGTSLAVAGSVLATLASVSSAQAATIDIATDNAWHTTSWSSGPGSILDDSFRFTIDSGNVGTLDVTDFQNVGDVYEVFNSSTSLGTTNFVDFDYSPYANTPDEGWADPRYSKGTFSLVSGTYDIFLRLNSGYSGGIAALRVSQSTVPVPVPAVVPGVILAGLFFGKKAMQRKQTLTTMI